MASGRMILLIRHPEALKNVEDRHGGEGTNLTEQGRSQCNALARFIETEYAPFDTAVLFGHRVPQVIDSIHILRVALGVPVVWDERLKGLNLGLLSGLSRREAAEQYPNAAERLQLWRAGKLKIDDLKLPGSEPFEEFRARVESVLNDWIRIKENNPIIAVCTRSVLIMLVNLIVLSVKFDTLLYQPYDFQSASLTTIFLNNDSQFIIERLNSTEYLDGV